MRRNASSSVLIAAGMAVMLASSARAQTGIEDGIYAVASRTVAITPDEAGVRITVTATGQKTLEDVLAAVKDLNIGLEHLISVVDVGSQTPTIPGVPATPVPTIYTFSTRVPIAQVRSALQRINQVPASAELRVAGAMSGVFVSIAAYEELQRKLFADLFKEAKARAQQMASDAGLSAGNVLAVADTNLLTPYTTSLVAAAERTFFVIVRVAIN